MKTLAATVSLLAVIGLCTWSVTASRPVQPGNFSPKQDICYVRGSDETCTWWGFSRFSTLSTGDLFVEFSDDGQVIWAGNQPAVFRKIADGRSEFARPLDPHRDLIPGLVYRKNAWSGEYAPCLIGSLKNGDEFRVHEIAKDGSLSIIDRGVFRSQD